MIIMEKENKNEITKQNICGQPCEVYSRIVGYYRPIQSWNKGKEEEYKDRTNYNSPERKGGEK